MAIPLTGGAGYMNFINQRKGMGTGKWTGKPV
jgi:hypothetical protein